MIPSTLIFPKSARAVAIYGTSCERIQDWVMQFQSCMLLPSIYVDASHQEEEINSMFTMGKDGSKIQQHSHRLPFSNHYWVNGNHFSAPIQVIVDDENKVSSLERRKAQLTNVRLVISKGPMPAHLIQWEVVSEQTSILHPDDKQGLENWIRTETAVPNLEALILVGGKSERMGISKMELNYNGEPQWKYLESICTQLKLPVRFSCSLEQQDFFLSQGKDIVLDQYGSIGPLGAIASAMNKQPGVSWLVLACDMPGLNAQAVSALFHQRDLKSMATAFWNDEKAWFEPLAAIWESHSKGEVFAWLAQSQCPRKLLSLIKTKSVNNVDAQWYQNVNTPLEREQWVKRQGE